MTDDTPSLFDDGNEQRPTEDVRPAHTCGHALSWINGNGECVHPSHSHPEYPVPITANHAPVGRRHPQTSKDAAARAWTRTGTKRYTTVEWYKDGAWDGNGGGTCDELEQVTGWTHQSASPILTGLHQHGWLEDSGERRNTRSGDPATVYRITDQTLDFYASL